MTTEKSQALLVNCPHDAHISFGPIIYCTTSIFDSNRWVILRSNIKGCIEHYEFTWCNLCLLYTTRFHSLPTAFMVQKCISCTFCSYTPFVCFSFHKCLWDQIVKHICLTNKISAARFSSTVYFYTVYICVYCIHCTFYLCMLVFVLYCVTDYLYEWEVDRDWILEVMYTVPELEQLLFATCRPIPHGCTAKKHMIALLYCRLTWYIQWMLMLVVVTAFMSPPMTSIALLQAKVMKQLNKKTTSVVNHTSVKAST